MNKEEAYRKAVFEKISELEKEHGMDNTVTLTVVAELYSFILAYSLSDSVKLEDIPKQLNDLMDALVKDVVRQVKLLRSEKKE